MLLQSCEESLPHTKEAFRLSPRDPQSAFWHLDIRGVEMCRGRFDAAVERFRRAIEGGLRIYLSYALLAAAEAQLGNDAEAKTALAEARRINPQLTMKWLVAHTPSSPKILEGLRKAGLPEE
jgi:tetratricopeptide (TPR) repeat protein